MGGISGRIFCHRYPIKELLKKIITLNVFFSEAVPIAEESHLSEVQASEVLNRIENGDPVVFDHVAIVGDIDITKLDLPIIHCESPAGQNEIAIVVASRIQIRNCELRGKVNFANILIKEPMDLSGSVFCEEARFKGICFQEDAGFEASVFKRYATFKDAYFAKDTRFQGACFFGNCQLRQSHLHRPHQLRLRQLLRALHQL